MARSGALVPAALILFASALSAQQISPGQVDYARDIQPLLRANCVGCHGPAAQNGGLRLDRRSSVFKPNARRVVPGSSENSFLFHRITSDTAYGQPMPPTGELKPAEVALLKRWIDQGAPWPDALANDADLPPVDPRAAALVEQLRTGDLPGFLRTVSATPALLNARGPEGSTPFMYAVLYTGVPTLTRLLALGADPNVANNGRATALLWAAHDLGKTALLLAHHANPNLRSDDFRTPLMVAARTSSGAPIVQLLLDHGANPNPNPHPDGSSSPVVEAATGANPESLELLLTHGATVQSDAELALGLAIYTRCARCVDLLIPRITDKAAYTGTLQDIGFVPDPHAIQLLLDHGADPKAADSFGRTALMYAAASDDLPLASVQLLVAHGADVNARSKHGNAADADLSVLDMALRHGDTPVTRFLLASGARPSASSAASPSLEPRFKHELRAAVEDSLPHLQIADKNFASKSGCISCHNNSLTAMTVSLARSKGLPVDESTAMSQVRANAGFLVKTRDSLHQGFLTPTGDTFGEGVFAYMLMGLHAEGYKPDLNTDAVVLYILARQRPDGQWFQATSDTREPLCLEHIGQTAQALRALQLYTPAPLAAESRNAIALAARWLAAEPSSTNDDRGWRVAGLAWALELPSATADLPSTWMPRPGSVRPRSPALRPAAPMSPAERATLQAALHKAVAELLATQKPDGSWADLPTMPSSAYATGKDLVALHLAGVPVSDPAWQRGLQWLLANQQQDGTWYVQSRSLAFQPSFDAGFPHGHNQWISAAGTNWATQALTYALPPPKAAPLTASR